MIALNQAFYRKIGRDEKGMAADSLIAFFESRGTRFVEEIDEDENAHQYVSYHRVLEKFMQALVSNSIPIVQMKPKVNIYPNHYLAFAPSAGEKSIPQQSLHYVASPSKRAPTERLSPHQVRSFCGQGNYEQI